MPKDIEFDVGLHLRQTLDLPVFHTMEGIEHSSFPSMDFREPTGKEERVLSIFGDLIKSVDLMPSALLEELKKIRKSIGADKYSVALSSAVVAIWHGEAPIPSDAKSFVEQFLSQKESLLTS